MPSRTRIATAGIDALAALLDNGWLRLYAGTQPERGDDPPESEPLAALRFGAPAFAGAEDATAQANPIAPDDMAAGGGIASWFRTFRADGITGVLDGSVGKSDSDLILDTTNIRTNARVTVSKFSIRQKS